jgi:hypothetical protein
MNSAEEQARNEGHGHEHHGHHHHGYEHRGDHEITFHIFVNGTPDEWHHHKISYEEVVQLAFPKGPHGGDVRYSVSWTRPDGEEGSLRPDHATHVVEGMSFDVRNTDKS